MDAPAEAAEGIDRQFRQLGIHRPHLEFGAAKEQAQFADRRITTPRMPLYDPMAATATAIYQELTYLWA